MSLLKAIGVVGAINECVNLFQFVRGTIKYASSQVIEAQDPKLEDGDVLQLQGDIQCLNDTLPAMYNLIDRAEWRSHENCVAELLPKLKSVVYDAEDLLDEFRWYELKVTAERNTTQVSPFVGFFHNVSQGSFNKVTDIQRRLNILSIQLEKMGLHEATPRFDKSVRPVTTSFRTEPKIFGRENELNEIIRLLGVPTYSTGPSSKRKRTSNSDNDGTRTACVPVLTIVGMGGVGKTTLAQEITTLQRVKSHFDKIIWICVSDDFDAERFTKILIKSLSGKEAMTDNLDDLQQDLHTQVGKKRFLLVLDDIWPDVLKEDGQYWRKFCAPLSNVLQGSMLLVTTRFAEVADLVGKTKSFALEGLKPEVFWNFFKLCVSGCENSLIDPQLELIGRSILPKLKGSPLAAKTIGRLLRKSLSTEHWNDILNNELWQLRQKETDILPALRLSYMYLPFHLKRCFSFCAVYPKDYNFEKASLAEIWVTEGFVEPEGNIPLQRIGNQYFEHLVSLSFFQKHRGKYVIHDLMHDMAQLVSKDECFIVKNVIDYEKVPQNVRHLSILASSDIKCSNLLSLCKHKKLRTLLCHKSLRDKAFASVMVRWFSELGRLRVIVCASIRELPQNISNLKHLRYLEITKACPFRRFPSSFCDLYNLQILYAKKCSFKNLPNGFSKLINLQKFEAQVPLPEHTMEVDAVEWRRNFWLINKINQITKDLIIYNLSSISRDHAEEIDIRKMEYLNNLTLRWSSLRSPQHNELEVLQALHPPTNLKSMHLVGYPGEYLPNWFRPGSLPTLTSRFRGYAGSVEHGNQYNVPIPTVIVDNNNTNSNNNNNGIMSSIFSSLTEIRIEGCEKLLSLEQFLQPSFLPSLNKIVVENCQRLSLRSAKVSCLEVLMVCDSPNIISGGLYAPCLKKLTLKESGKLEDNLTSILHPEMWSLPALQNFMIIKCESLTFIGESTISNHRGSRSSGTFASLTELEISNCRKLHNIDDFLSQEYLPAIEKIIISGCKELRFLHCERFGRFSFLRELEIGGCPHLNWQSGMELPSSLQKLTLWSCGDFSCWFPSCLKNLTLLESLEIVNCGCIVSVPGNLWSSVLVSLQELRIWNCLDLVSIGGPIAIANIEKVHITGCENLREVQQPLRRGDLS